MPYSFLVSALPEVPLYPFMLNRWLESWVCIGRKCERGHAPFEPVLEGPFLFNFNETENTWHTSLPTLFNLPASNWSRGRGSTLGDDSWTLLDSARSLLTSDRNGITSRKGRNFALIPDRNPFFLTVRELGPRAQPSGKEGKSVSSPLPPRKSRNGSSPFSDARHTL